MPLARAFLARSSPTLAAPWQLPPSLSLSWTEELETMVTPLTSSMICASMFLLERKTQRRGLAAVPEIFSRTLTWCAGRRKATRPPRGSARPWARRRSARGFRGTAASKSPRAGARPCRSPVRCLAGRPDFPGASRTCSKQVACQVRKTLGGRRQVTPLPSRVFPVRQKTDARAGKRRGRFCPWRRRPAGPSRRLHPTVWRRGTPGRSGNPTRSGR